MTMHILDHVDAARDQTVFMPEKTNISMIWGQATGLRYGDTDTLALRVEEECGTGAPGAGEEGLEDAPVRHGAPTSATP